MTVEFDVSQIGDWKAIIEDAAEDEIARTNAEIAFGAEHELRSRSTTVWPQKTGFSRDRFRADDVAGANMILVTNTAPYAKYVNNSPRLRNGRTNPNFGSAQETVRRYWDRILRGAVRRAATGAS